MTFSLIYLNFVLRIVFLLVFHVKHRFNIIFINERNKL